MVGSMSAHPIRAPEVEKFVESIVGEDMHAKRILSISNAVLGTVHAAALGVHAIGQALAQARNLQAKHAIKQVDRLLSNRKFDPWGFFEHWVPFVVGDRKELVVAMDWTDFDHDDHSTLAISVVTGHGRATPLLWMTVTKSDLANWRNQHEDDLLLRFREVLPHSVKVTILADRGFGDRKLYEFLDELGFNYVIRFRGSIFVTDEHGEGRPASDWVPSNGRPRLIRGAKVTKGKQSVGAVVCVHAKGMKDPWCLVTSHETLTGSEIVKLYGRRFTIEESFRDTKNLRFGMGLSSTRIKDPERRDRLLLISAIGSSLITLLGAAGESLGMDRMLKANTAKKRTHSLFRQGQYYYGAIPNMREEWLRPLVDRFGQMIQEQASLNMVFGYAL